MSDVRYRMIAIDLDGTLLSPFGQVTARTKRAIHRCLSAGLLVCFATGRNWTESQVVLDAVEHYDTAVFVGGAMVVDTKQKLTLHRTMMQPQLARALCEYFESHGFAALALLDTGVTGVDYLISGDVPLNEATEQWMRATSSVIHPVQDLASHAHEHTMRVGIVASREQTRRAKKDLEDRFGSEIVCHSLFVPSYDVEVLEVFDPSVNKWEGILHVARRHSIEAKEIIAIGDDLNDVAMLRNAGLGVAMGNGRPEVLAIADRVIGTNADDGLAQFLEELVVTHQVEPLANEGEKQ